MLIFASPVKGAQRRPGAAIFVPFDCSFKSSAFTPTGSAKTNSTCDSHIAKFCVCVFACVCELLNCLNKRKLVLKHYFQYFFR